MMCDETLREAIDTFILERINNCGSRTNPALRDAYTSYADKVKKLKETLSSEQQSLFIDCENPFALVDGETMNCYYRAGFSDAVLFLLGWRDQEWN